MADALEELVARLDGGDAPSAVLLEDLPNQSFSVTPPGTEPEWRPAPHTGAICLFCTKLIEPNIYAWRSWNETLQRGVWWCCDRQ